MSTMKYFRLFSCFLKQNRLNILGYIYTMPKPKNNQSLAKHLIVLFRRQKKKMKYRSQDQIEGTMALASKNLISAFNLE